MCCSPGLNPFDAHPVIASEVMRAKYEGGAKIIVADPRRTELADRADLWLRLQAWHERFAPELDRACHRARRAGRHAFIGARTENFAAFAASLDGYAP